MRETYPGLGFDPTPGETADVAAVLARLSDGHTAVAGVAGELGRAVRRGGWRGAAASAFHAGTAELPGVLDEVAVAIVAVRETLAAWHDRLSANKREADRLDRLARRLRDEPEAVERVLDQAHRLRARHLRQATAAARSVRGQLGVVVPPDGWDAGSELVAGVSARVSTWSGTLAAIGGAPWGTTVTAGAVDLVPARVSLGEPVGSGGQPSDQPGGRPLPVAGPAVADAPVARAPAGSRPLALSLATAPVLGTTTTAGTRHADRADRDRTRPADRADRGVTTERTGTSDRVDRGIATERTGRGAPVHGTRPESAARVEHTTRAQRFEPARRLEPAARNGLSDTTARTGWPEPTTRAGWAEPTTRAGWSEPTTRHQQPDARTGSPEHTARTGSPEPATRHQPPEHTARTGSLEPAIRNERTEPTTRADRPDTDPNSRSNKPTPDTGRPAGHRPAFPEQPARTGIADHDLGPRPPAPTGPNHDQQAETDLGLTAMLFGAAAGSATHDDTTTTRFGRLRGFLINHPESRPVLALFLVRRTDDGRVHRRSLFLPATEITSERNANG